VANDHRVNGTMADASEYDGDGDYLSLLSATVGKVRITFDPAKRPRAGIETLVEFDEPRGTSAELAKISRRLATQRELLRKGTELGSRRSVPSLTPDAIGLAWLNRELRGAVDSKQPVVRRAALVAMFAFQPGPDAARFANQALAEVAPTDPIWGIEECAFAHVVEAATDEQKKAVSVSAFIAGQALTAPLGCYLVTEVTRHPGDREKVQAAMRLLQSERFARTKYAWAPQRSNISRSLAAGKPLPEFTVGALDGKNRISPAQLKGKLYLIDVWATWCQPCVQGLPSLHDAFAKFGKRGKRPLHVLSISFDEKPEDVTQFRKGPSPMPWEHAFATDQEKRALQAVFGPTIPFYALVDERGNVVACSPELRSETLSAILAKLPPK
jgi:thiol-disulfide isomerase/thioredoxin